MGFFAGHTQVVFVCGGIEFACFHGLQHSTTGFGGMGAIRESAISGQEADLVESSAEALARIGDAHLAHAGVVDQDCPVLQDDQLAVAGDVPSLAGAGADRIGFHQVASGKEVQEG